MATVEFPIQQVDRQRFVIRLDGTDCRIEVFFQPRDGAWYMNLEVPVGTTAISGRRLSLDAPVMGKSVRPLPGQIYCRATGNTSDDPGRMPWGISHKVTYETP